MRVTRVLCVVLVGLCVLLTGAAAFADGENNFYIIEDSDRRYLTEDELWDWQYDALGYIYNEFFARYGRAFRTGEKYDRYFRSQAWYQVNPNYHYGLLNRIEQTNEKLVHEVLKDMRALKTTNPSGRPLPSSGGQARAQGVLPFRSYSLVSGQKLEVYTGPGKNFVRSGGGKASVSTNGAVKIAGSEGDWLAVEYSTNGGSQRIGYILGTKLKDRLRVAELALYDQDETIVKDCSLTDEPDGVRTRLISLRSGTPVIYLGPYSTGVKRAWAYIQVDTQDGPARGFVPAECVSGGAVGAVGDEAESVDDLESDGNSLPVVAPSGEGDG